MANRNINRNVRRAPQFTSTMRKKLVTLFFLVLLAFVGLSARLIMINRENGEQYKKQVLSQQSYSSTNPNLGKVVLYQLSYFRIVDSAPEMQPVFLIASAKIEQIFLLCKLFCENF